VSSGGGFFLSRFGFERTKKPVLSASAVSFNGNWGTVGSALLVGVAYYLGTRIGFAFTPSGQPNSTFWPANAILLAAFLLTPGRTWWTLVLAVLPAHLLSELNAGVPVWTAIGWFVTNTSEALIGAYCITRLADTRKLFDTVRGILVFVIFGVLIAPLVTSFLDAAAVVVTGWGRGYVPISTERFWTNALAELTVVPTIVLFSSNPILFFRKAGMARIVEGVLLFGTTALIAFLIFGIEPISLATSPALLYLPLPFLLWATTRFGPRGLSVCLLLLSLISLWCAMHGHEPFPYASMPENVASLQILLCLVVVPLLFLSAIMAEARRTEESLRNVSGSLIDAQEQERNRIARELHDDLGQSLALARVRLNGLMEGSQESLKPALTELSHQISSISNAAHEISLGLYPRQLEYLGLATAMKKLCDEVGRGKHISVQLTVGNLPRQLKPSISLCLYRVVQEALHNILKHSQAKNVQVALGTEHDNIMLMVADDGIGFNPSDKGDGLGLASMRHRVRSVGGTIAISSSSKAGSRIEVRVARGGWAAENDIGAA
jgi:signal transduction histidine kinase